MFVAYSVMSVSRREMIFHRQADIKQKTGGHRDGFTLIALLKACTKKKDPYKGSRLHADILKRGLLKRNHYVASALINMYAKCSVLGEAQKVHDELPVRSVVTWNALISGYVYHAQNDDALNCFEQMQREGVTPNSVTFICILKACGKVGAIAKGKQIHDEINSRDLLKNDVILGTALVDMYAKCRVIVKARQVHDDLHIKNAVSWSALISGYVQHGQSFEALNCYACMQSQGLCPNDATFTCILKACSKIRDVQRGIHIHQEIAKRGLLEKNIVIGNALVDMYANIGMVRKSHEVLENLPFRDVVSWSTLISGYVQQRLYHDALNCFEQMQNEGISPDAATLTCILKAYGGTGAIDKGKIIHDKISNAGFLRKNVAVGTALVDMYIKFGMLANAQQVLDELPIRNMITWSALITGFAQHGQGHEALYCFQQMQNEGISADAVTFSSILKACGIIGAFEKGEQIHDGILRRDLLANDIVLATSLVDMYAHLGLLAKAYHVLQALPCRNTISWSALISGYARERQGHNALSCFQEMQRDGFSPDAVSLLCILNACRLSGLIDEAEMHFGCMTTMYGIVPKLEHHTCMIMVFGSAGQFEKAMSVITSMPSSDYPPVWLALLRACRKWGNVNLARLAFDHVIQIDKYCSVAYKLMEDIYAALGRNEDAMGFEVMRSTA